MGWCDALRSIPDFIDMLVAARCHDESWFWSNSTIRIVWWGMRSPCKEEMVNRSCTWRPTFWKGKDNNTPLYLIRIKNVFLPRMWSKSHMSYCTVCNKSYAVCAHVSKYITDTNDTNRHHHQLRMTSAALVLMITAVWELAMRVFVAL